MNDEQDREAIEREAVEEHLTLRSPVIYEVVRREGLTELERPPASLWWSGVAAGIGVSASFYCQGFLAGLLPEAPWALAVSSLGYCVGFLIVVIGRLQLFTEVTITVVLPILARPHPKLLLRGARLWGLVLAANLAGTFVSAAFVYFGGVSPEHVGQFLALAAVHSDRTFWETLSYGVPAGFLVAALVWMLPSAEGNGVLLVLIVSYFIAAGELAHVVVGSTAAFLLVLARSSDLLYMLFHVTLPAFLGNVLGGTGLFALIAYGQVRKEI